MFPMKRKRTTRKTTPKPMPNLLKSEQGQDVAEYAVLLAVILVIAIGIVHLIGSNASNVFSQIGSKIGG